MWICTNPCGFDYLRKVLTTPYTKIMISWMSLEFEYCTRFCGLRIVANTSQTKIMKGSIIMILIGIDIGKSSHTFCILNQTTGEEIVSPTNIKNNKSGFEILLSKVKNYKKEEK